MVSVNRGKLERKFIEMLAEEGWDFIGRFEDSHFPCRLSCSLLKNYMPEMNEYNTIQDFPGFYEGERLVFGF